MGAIKCDYLGMVSAGVETELTTCGAGFAAVIAGCCAVVMAVGADMAAATGFGSDCIGLTGVKLPLCGTEIEGTGLGWAGF